MYSRQESHIFNSNEFADSRTLSHIYDNTVATYKFYWFASILDVLVIEGKTEMSFWEIIAGMLSESWYPIHYFKISFGKADSIYQQSMAIKDYLGIPKDKDKNSIKSTILSSLDDKKALSLVRVFTQNVPYRFLHPWIGTSDNKEMELRSRSYENDCLYAIYDKTIVLNPNWIEYLKANYSVLKDFTFWNLNTFLQKRNPNVPDLSSKLVKPIQRESLNHQRKLWDIYLKSQGGINCIYTNNVITKGNYDLDHFIPWSFVSHNQMWDLLPADSSINSSKSDHLPKLEDYLKPYCEIQHNFISFIFGLNQNERLLEDYLAIHSSISDLIHLDKNDFTQAFHNVLSPLVQIASNMGFTYWNKP